MIKAGLNALNLLCNEYIVTICQFVELIQIDFDQSRMKYKTHFRDHVRIENRI